MQSILFLLLRRMRTPLIVLICIYALSIIGFTLIPGQDDQGNPWRMDFFHAFYFVSFMGSTIGFGEIPYPFTEAQRSWAIVSIYISVISWLYAIGAMLGVVQDPAFRRVLTENRFRKNINNIREPFYLICGYGDTGSLLTRELTSQGILCAVLDIRQEQIDMLTIAEYYRDVPGLCADAAVPDALKMAGLTNPYCEGIVALTDNDQANLEIAITSKLLNPDLLVICRAETMDIEANMDSFGTEHIINPYMTFARRMAMALHSPSQYLIYDWLTSPTHTPLDELLDPPRGKWVLCGYGRFGRAVHQYLEFEGIDTTVIELEESLAQDHENVVVGRGTEAVTLRQAKADRAVGIVAGTDNDANNLSIVMTAKQMNPDLFTVLRQNSRANDEVVEHAGLDLVMQPGAIIAGEILALIKTPLLADFLRKARHHDDEWAALLVSRIIGVVGEDNPDSWMVQINEEEASAVYGALEQHQTDVTVGHLVCNPQSRDQKLACLPLLIKRGKKQYVLPDNDFKLKIDDQILFCGNLHALHKMPWILQNYNVLCYVVQGTSISSGWLWKKLTKGDKPIQVEH